MDQRMGTPAQTAVVAGEYPSADCVILTTWTLPSSWTLALMVVGVTDVRPDRPVGTSTPRVRRAPAELIRAKPITTTPTMDIKAARRRGGAPERGVRVRRVVAVVSPSPAVASGSPPARRPPHPPSRPRPTSPGVVPRANTAIVAEAADGEPSETA